MYHPANVHSFRYSKIGYAANMQPQCIIPSCIAVKEYGKVGNREARRLGTGLDDLNFYIGDEAIAADGKNDFSLKVFLRVFGSCLMRASFSAIIKVLMHAFSTSYRGSAACGP